MLNILKNTELFSNIDEKDFTSLLKCLNGKARSYKKGEFILLAGISAPVIGIVLSGTASIIKETISGDQTIIRKLRIGEMFGEIYACIGISTIPVSVYAEEDTEVVIFDIEKITGTCPNACPHHRLLINNLLKIFAIKNSLLNKKMSYISHKTIREKIFAFLYDYAQEKGAFEFELPYNRTELADYLCSDRSALSRELSNMKKDGLLDCEGKKFKLYM